MPRPPTPPRPTARPPANPAARSPATPPHAPARTTATPSARPERSPPSTEPGQPHSHSPRDSAWNIRHSAPKAPTPQGARSPGRQRSEGESPFPQRQPPYHRPTAPYSPSETISRPNLGAPARTPCTGNDGTLRPPSADRRSPITQIRLYPPREPATGPHGPEGRRPDTLPHALAPPRIVAPAPRSSIAHAFLPPRHVARARARRWRVRHGRACTRHVAPERQPSRPAMPRSAARQRHATATGAPLRRVNRGPRGVALPGDTFALVAR